MEAFINFTALAYPVPPPSSFTWSKLEVTNWTVLSNNSKIHISVKGLFSFLKLTNVSQSDYGIYQLNVTNDVGSFTQRFHLLPEGITSVFVRKKAFLRSTRVLR